MLQILSMGISWPIRIFMGHKIHTRLLVSRFGIFTIFFMKGYWSYTMLKICFMRISWPARIFMGHEICTRLLVAFMGHEIYKFETIENFMAHENQVSNVYKVFMGHESQPFKISWKFHDLRKHHEIWNLWFQGHEKCFHGFFKVFSWDFHEKDMQYIKTYLWNEWYTEQNLINEYLILKYNFNI